jgi:hypothetical protein
MRKGIIVGAVGALTLLSGCTSIGGPGVSTYFECDRGTRLKVDYTGNGAIVRVDGGRTLALRSTPANSGAIYEGRGGERLAVNGGTATWNTAARSAPESCRTVAVPR